MRYLAYLLTENFQEYLLSLDLLKQSLELDPTNPRVHNSYAHLLHSHFDEYTALARKHYELALQLNPKPRLNMFIHFNLAHLLHTRFEEFELARFHYEYVLDIDSNSVFTRINLALLFEMHLNDHDSAVMHLDALYSINPLVFFNSKLEQLHEYLVPVIVDCSFASFTDTFFVLHTWGYTPGDIRVIKRKNKLRRALEKKKNKAISAKERQRLIDELLDVPKKKRKKVFF